MASKNTTYNKGKKKLKKVAKKYVKRNKGFVVALVLCIALGLGLGVGANVYLTQNDAFTLYESNTVYTGDIISIESGNTYQLESIENSVDVVSFGKDLTQYVVAEVKYKENDEAVIESLNTTTFTNDGTYYVIYSLSYTGDDFLTSLIVSKYDKVKLRKTIVIGGEDNE